MLVHTPFVEAITREEVGHALDHTLGWVSRGGLFQACQAEASRITDPAEISELAYVLVQSQGGVQRTPEDAAEELFASLFALYYGGAVGVPYYGLLLQQHFLQSFQELRNIVATQV